MPQSHVQYAANGSNRGFAVPFLYINKSHVRAKVAGAFVSFTWSNDSFIQLDAIPPAGTVVEVRRTTPNDARAVDFVDGSTLTESDLDRSNQQFLYLSQEAQDRAEAAPGLTAENTYDFQGRRATNLADPVADQDAVTKAWAVSAAASTLAGAVAARDKAVASEADAEAAAVAAISARDAAIQAVNTPGRVGPKGDTGAAGATGAKGDAGATGAKGDTGATGPAGSSGASNGVFGNAGSIPGDTLTGAVTGGSYFSTTPSKAKGFPFDTGSCHVLTSTANSAGTNFALQLASQGNGGGEHYIRSTNNSGASNWDKLWHTGNFDPQNQSFNKQVGLRAETDPVTGESRIKIERNNPLNTNFTDVFMYKDTRGKPAGSAGVSTMLRIEQQVGSANAYQWPLLVKTEISGAASSANHVGITSQMFTTADAGFYGMCGENRDGWENPSTASVAFELDIYGKGGDNFGNRIGLDLVYGAYYPLLAGDHTVHCGIRVSPLQNVSNWTAGQSYPDGVAQSSGRALMRFGLQMKGNVGTGIDLSGIRQDYSNEAMFLANGQIIKWANNAYIGFNSDKFIFNTGSGGLGASGSMPGSIVGSILVNVGGLGNCRIPLIAA